MRERTIKTGLKIYLSVFKPPTVYHYFSLTHYLPLTMSVVFTICYFVQCLLIFNIWWCLFFVSSQDFTTQTENVAHKNQSATFTK